VLIERAFTSVVQDGKKAIRTRNQGDKLSCTRLATLLLAALMESRLNEALWYYSGLKEDDRPPLLKMSVENRWKQLVAISFANRRNLRSADIPERLEFTDRARHDEIMRVVAEHVIPLVQVRNVLAHGQWVYVFTESRHSIDSTKMATLNSFTLWRVILEKNLLDHLNRIVHDVLATKFAHERDFDRHIKNLRAARGRIKKGNRTKWERTLMARHDRRPTFVP
jgi:hypothetical protein